MRNGAKVVSIAVVFGLLAGCSGHFHVVPSGNDYYTPTQTTHYYNGHTPPPTSTEAPSANLSDVLGLIGNVVGIAQGITNIRLMQQQIQSLRGR